MTIGDVCRSRDAILRMQNEDEGRICRIVAEVPPARWRNPAIPEYRVELLTMPVTAFRRASDLIPLVEHAREAAIST